MLCPSRLMSVRLYKGFGRGPQFGTDLTNPVALERAGRQALELGARLSITAKHDRPKLRQLIDIASRSFSAREASGGPRLPGVLDCGAGPDVRSGEFTE